MMDYREEGILSEALVNYLAFLGWSPGDDREYFSLEELCAAFTIEGIQKNGASWNREKLLSVNQYWMRRLPDADFKKNLAAVSLDEAMVTKVIPLLKERVRTFGEARTMLAEELSFFFEKPSIAKETLLVKDPDNMLTSDVLEAFASATVTASGHLDAEAYKALLMPIAEKREAEGKGGRGQALWALRYALSGKERSPDPFTITSLLGKDESVQRLRAARMLANA